MKRIILITVSLTLLFASAYGQNDVQNLGNGLMSTANNSDLPPDKKQQLNEIVQRLMILSQDQSVPPSVLLKETLTWLCMFKYGYLYFFGTLPPEEATNQIEVLVLRAFLQLYAEENNPIPPKKPAPPPPPPPKACTVTLVVPKSLTPTDPLGQFSLGMSDALGVGLTAKGAPAGGSYAWNITPPSPAPGGSGGFLATLPNNPKAVFGATASGTYKVTVTYTDPNGKKCKATVKLTVR